jgi:energy-coupling factor transporter ATP-binding protein EcfA2
MTLTNFRCFGPKPTTIKLRDLTAFVGGNGSGKTAVLVALQRLFGTSAPERELKPDDFHCPHVVAEDAAPVKEVTLTIEVKLVFPELDSEGKEPSEKLDAVADCFRHMVVLDAGETPFCRVRLEGTWTASNVPEGDVEQHTYWITPDPDSAEEETKHEMRASDRSRIHVHYIPAARDPLRQMRQTSGSVMARLFSAAKWSDAVKQEVEKSSGTIREAFGQEAGVDSIQAALTNNWTLLHDATAYSGVSLRPVSNRFEEVLRHVEAVFSPSPAGEEHPLERLSDGQRSLFYLTLVATAFEIEEAALKASTEELAFDLDRLDPPSLTIFAVEEPENHISPHYLGRIMEMLRKLAKSPRGQVLLASHSPSIMYRVEPEEVRHTRLDPATRTSIVRRIKLPTKSDEAHKFIREAVKAHPELYFARLVVLGEGDSEEIVLPRVADARGMPIDRSFVSIVPLGGRHVNHMWRLLSTLKIPYVTLLDLDTERYGGGWGRIKYAIMELLAIGIPNKELLTVRDAKGGDTILPDDQLQKMHDCKHDEKVMAGWLEMLETFDVFASKPLDLDLLMLMAFPEEYHASVESGRGPSMAKDDSGKEEAVRAVLKKAGGDGSTYTPKERAEFPWYAYLFLGRSKPVTHVAALADIEPEKLKKDCPPVLRRLVSRMKEKLQVAAAEEPDAT